MTLLFANPNLNREGQEDFVDRLSATHAGQAHLAGTGPAGRTCRECEFWAHSKKWSKDGFAGPGEPMPAPCVKYRQLRMMPKKKSQPRVGHAASACRHFSETPLPQPLVKPRKESW